MKERHESVKRKRERGTLLTFLKRTKEGKYAPVEKSSLPYARLSEEREEIEIYEQEYYYNIS